ncbi:hypothetical protein ACVQ8P_04310 [Dellaglioa sp. BT-FLS60]
MKRFKDYSISLLKGLASLIILLAIGKLLIPSDWQSLSNYYLILNFLTFYPYNLELDGLNKKVIQKFKKDEAAEPKSRQEMNTRKISTENVTRLLIHVVQFAGLILIAPGQFMYYYLIKN